MARVVERIPVDRVTVDQRAAALATRSIKAASKIAALRMAVSMVDLTTLEGKDSEEKVRSLCRKAIRPDASDPSIPSVGAVCVYPEMVPATAAALRGSTVAVASVASGFPSGQYPLDVRLDDVRRAVDAGADEIDMVISRGRFLAGEWARVSDEIAQIKDACGPVGGAHLKVILETGELETYENVRFASDLAIHSGLQDGDFIKTSTGKVAPAATMGVTLVMLEAVRDHYLRTGVRIGVKPAGGIRTAKQAVQYLVMVKETVGEAWLHPRLFRFGASALLNDLLRQLARMRRGVYVSDDDFGDA